MRSLICSIVALSAAAALPGRAAAQSLRRPAGAADLGLAGASALGVVDPNSQWLNPAELVVSQTRATLGIAVRSVQLRSSARSGARRSRSIAKPTVAPAVAVAIPLWSERLQLAAGYRYGWQARLRLPAAAQGSPADPVRFFARSLSLDSHDFNLALAAHWRWLRVGASLQISYVRLDADQPQWLGGDDSARVDQRAFDLGLVSQLSGPGLTGRVGVTFAPLWWLAAAAVARLPQRVWLDGTTTPARPTSLAPGIDALQLEDGPASMQLTLPAKIQLALSLFLLRWARLGAQLDVSLPSDPSRLVHDPIGRVTGSSGTRTLTPQARVIAAAGDVSLACHLALELTLLARFVRMQIGWAYRQSPTRNRAQPAPLLDSGGHQLGVGVVLSASRVRLAIGVAHRFPTTTRYEKGLRPADPLGELGDSASGSLRLAASQTIALAELQVSW